MGFLHSSIQKKLLFTIKKHHFLFFFSLYQSFLLYLNLNALYGFYGRSFITSNTFSGMTPKTLVFIYLTGFPVNGSLMNEPFFYTRIFGTNVIETTVFLKFAYPEKNTNLPKLLPLMAILFTRIESPRALQWKGGFEAVCFSQGCF